MYPPYGFPVRYRMSFIVAASMLILCEDAISGERYNMQRIKIHEWRDWLLEQVEEDTYELLDKSKRSATATKIKAKNSMDAENQCQQIIKQGGKNTPS